MRRICVATVAMLLAALFCAVTVLAAAPDEETAFVPSLSFGMEGRENNTVLDGDALYELLFGEAPTSATADYLEAQGLTLRYNGAISAGCVSTDYQAQTGVLSLTVRPYRYTAENGTEVVWLPTGATVDGQAVALTASDGVYTARIEGLFRSENFDMTVDYSWSATIPASVLDRIRNGAYRVGDAAAKEWAAYESAHEEYLRLSAEYLAWQAYLEQKLAYDAYAEALSAYEAQVKAYDAYVEAKALYDKEDAAYKEWQTYFTALATYTEQYERYTAHQSYLSAMKEVDRKISLMDSVYVSDSHHWNMYASIMGGTVSRVIDNKDELVNLLHCNEEDVDLAKASTEALRPILKGYDTVRKTPRDSAYKIAKAKYEYFIANYDALTLHFKNLYKTLNGFLSNTFVERALQSEGKREHYLQFVGQLYVISTCLDSEGERRADWTVGGKPLEAVVEECHLLPEGDWDPRRSSLPEYAPSAECPAPVTIPTVEMPAHKPIPPTPVDKPSATPPTPVEDPDLGEIPPRCEEAPVTEPVPPTFDEDTKALMKEVQEGLLTPSAKVSEDRTVPFVSRLFRPVSILNEKLVTFYDIDGEILRQELVSYGSSLSYAPPEHAPSPEYEYRLLGWIGAEGNEVDLRFITTDLDLYPHYEITKKSYTVTWRVIGADGKVHESSSVWTYGAIPTPGAQVPCISYDENGYSYTFSGWSPEILPVTGPVTYEGRVVRSPKKYTVTWVLEDRTVTEILSYGELPVFLDDPSFSTVNASYTFLGWSPAVSVVEDDATYIARYDVHHFATSGTVALEVESSKTRLTVLAQTHASVTIKEMLTRAKDAGKELGVRWENGCELILDHGSVKKLAASDCSRVVLQSFSTENETVFELHFYNSLLKDAALAGAKPVLHLPFVVEEDGRTAAFYLEKGEEETRIEMEYLNVTGPAVIRRIWVYPLSVLPDVNCNTGAAGYDAPAGTLISLKLPCLFGYEVTGATVTDADGNEMTLTDLSFVMPSSPVRVTLRVEKMVYRVVFRVDGVVLTDTEYAFGDEIAVPDAPQKPADDNTVYTFVSWGAEVPTHATGDARELIFDAVFSAQIKNIDYDTGHNNNLLAQVILPVILGAMLLVGATVTLVVILRRRRK